MEALQAEFTAAMRNRVAPDFQVTESAGQAVPAAMALSYGLALTEVQSPRSFDLLPRPTVGERWSRTLSWVLSLLVTAAMGGYAFYWSLSVPEMQVQQSTQRANLARIQAQLVMEPQIAAEEASAQRMRPLLAPWTSRPTSSPHC